MNSVSIGFAVACGLVIGILSDPIQGMLGGMIGYLFGEIIVIKRRLTDFELMVKQNITHPSKSDSPKSASASTQTGTSPSTPSDDSLIFEQPASPTISHVINEGRQPASTSSPTADVRFPEKSILNTTEPQEKEKTLLERFLTGGNLMVRVGVIVLFFGMAFLVKYAAERNLLPIELRLIAVAIFGMGLTVIGWRLRQRRFGYALAIQGGGVGVLYLTIFGAAKLYDLIPLPLALVIMVALVTLSTLLALLQNARSLALLGTVGGFLAPILTASGTGNHVMLFSYYLLLNLGILAVAWFKTWRELNWAGFLFTFGIGAVWGLSAYQEKYLASTEPFLIIFFLIYFVLSVLFALRQPVNLRGYVDGSLVFGLPFAAFGLQAGLMAESEFGLAISAIILAALYIVTATVLWKLHRATLQILIEAFLALGVVFVTVAVPLALSGHWTAGTWALEGCALYWVGTRQKRLLARCSGLLLQIGAAVQVAFLLISHKTGGIVSGGILASAGFVISYLLQAHMRILRQWERKLAVITLIWSVGWWLGTGFHYIDLKFSEPRESQVGLVFVTGTLACLGRIGRKLQWPQVRWLGLALLPIMLIFAAYSFDHRIKANPFREQWWIVWLINFIAMYDLLKSNEAFWGEQAVKIYHIVGGLLLIFLLTWDAAYWINFGIATSETWPLAVWGAVPALFVFGLLEWGDQAWWPLNYRRLLYRHQMVAVILVYLLLWGLGGCFEEGNPVPLHYLPIVNPIDLVTLFVVLLIIKWHQLIPHQPLVAGWVLPNQVKVGVLGGFGCIWLSAIVIRTIHFWAQVPHDAPNLATSALVQTSLSVLWTLYAMGVLLLSTRKGYREGWIAGAGLLGVVVIKLFLVDLSGSGTIARIISFVAVGILMLVIGYFSPLPPSIRKENSL